MPRVPVLHAPRNFSPRDKAPAGRRAAKCYERRAARRLIPGTSGWTVRGRAEEAPKLEARLGTDTFVAAWGTPLRGEAPHGDENDVAVAVAARGAWTRFWVRGARYLRRCISVAGFYLGWHRSAAGDGRGVPSRGRRLDLHAANKTAVYLELYPYLDSVWTGEASYLEGDANHYLVAIAGLPFGRPSQLLAGKL